MEAVTEKEERGAESVQRWTAKRRSALVLSILRGETSAQEAARKHGLTVAEIEGWQERYLLAAENALRSRPRDEEALKDEQIKKLKQKIGDLVTDVDILKEAMKPYRLRRRGCQTSERGDPRRLPPAVNTPATLFFSPRSIRFPSVMPWSHDAHIAPLRRFAASCGLSSAKVRA